MARLDTGWHVNPKVLQVGLQGMGLHAWSISYCDHARSDGFIPSGAWPSLPGAGAAVKALLTIGLWERVEGGFQLHDYREYNRSRAEIEADQEAARERQSRHRSRVTEPVTNGVTSAEHPRAPATPARTGDRAPGPGPGVTLKRDTPSPPNPLLPETADAQGPAGTASAPNPKPAAQTCPMCNRTFIGPYADHRCAIGRPPRSIGKILGRPSDIPLEEIDRVERELADYRQRLDAQKTEQVAK